MVSIVVVVIPSIEVISIVTVPVTIESEGIVDDVGVKRRASRSIEAISVDPFSVIVSIVSVPVTIVTVLVTIVTVPVTIVTVPVTISIVSVPVIVLWDLVIVFINFTIVIGFRGSRFLFGSSNHNS